MRKAVITADIIHSSKMSIEHREWLLKEIEQKLETLYKLPPVMESEMYRGDSFQCQLSTLRLGLRTALILKTFIKSLNPSEVTIVSDKQGIKSQEVFRTKRIFDVRLSLGLGEVISNSTTIGMSDGEAFQLSGRMLDEMKKHKTSFGISTNDDFKEELATESALLDFILFNATALQCEVIYWKLQGITEINIAEKLTIQQAAVNQRSTAGGWQVIEKALKRFETIYAND